MTVDAALSIAYAGLYLALFVSLSARRTFKALPLFCAYLICGGFAFIIAEAILLFAPGFYLRFFIVYIAVDGLLYFCVLEELGRNVLRYNRVIPPHWFVIVLLFALFALLAIFLAGWTVPTARSLLSAYYYQEMRIIEILEFAGFLALVCWSSLRKLSWPNRELRLATGFGLSTLVWFLIAILHALWTTGAAYHWLDQAGQAVYLAVLVYWLHYFWIEADREPASRSMGSAQAPNRDRKSTKRMLRIDSLWSAADPFAT